jgi:polyphosphate kinase
MTCDPKISSDISALFNVMTGYSAPMEEWKKIAVAPFDLRKKFISLIDREARLSTSGNPGRIIAKINSLVDPEIIRHLYCAAYAGVKIDLIVRGICCLRPEMGTDNITVTSIVDRYLEHARIFYFGNNGTPEYYLSSADWMPRNLDRRIELLFPVENERIQELFDEIINIQLSDKEKGRVLQQSGNYTRKFAKKHSDCRSQWKTYLLFKQALSETEMLDRNQKLNIFSSNGNITDRIKQIFTHS